MADKKMYKVGITVKEPWSADISYEVLDVTLYAVENGGDGCSYIAIRANQGVTPGTDDTVWVKATQAGQSIYDLAVKYHHFVGTEEEFEQQYQDALAAANNAASAASATDEQIQANELARVSAENSRVTAERARSDAETARSSAETARINAENARNNAESLRDIAESDRVRAEAGRVTAEASRVEAETFRQGAEQSRRQQFEALKTDMETAIDNVDAKAAEIEEDIEGYEANEAERVSAEQSRVSAESSRVSAESARVTAETERVAQASSDHTRAETDHGTAASDHTTAQADHTQAASDHTDITRARLDAETATSEANMASLRANEAADTAIAAAADATEAAGTIDAKIATKQDVIADLPQIREGASNNVKYTSQSLTDAQKEQARTNIGAASDSEVSQLRSELIEEDKAFTPTWDKVGKYLSLSGKVSTSSAWSISAPFILHKGWTLKVRTEGSGATIIAATTDGTTYTPLVVSPSGNSDLKWFYYTASADISVAISAKVGQDNVEIYTNGEGLVTSLESDMNGSTRTLTGNGRNYLYLDEPIKAGDVIHSASGIPSTGFYLVPASGTSKWVYVFELPYTCEFDVVRLDINNPELVTYTITVKHPGVREMVEDKSRVIGDYLFPGYPLSVSSGKLAEALHDILALRTMPIEASSTAENYALRANALSVQDSNSRISKYTVLEGDVLYLKLTKDNDAVYQFQNAASAPASYENTAVIGPTITKACEGLVVVPEGATYLMVSSLKTNTTNSVKKVLTDNIPGYVEEEKERVYDLLVSRSSGDVHIAAFNTDQHFDLDRIGGNGTYDPRWVMQGVKAMLEIANKLPIDQVVFGGDVAGYNGVTSADVDGIYKTINYLLVPASETDTVVVGIPGNHDAYQNNANVTAAGMHNAYAKKNERHTYFHGNGADNCDAYWDDTTHKIRTILVDTYSTNGRTEDFRVFLEAALSTLPTGYNALIFSHNPLSNEFAGTILAQKISDPTVEIDAFQNPSDCHAILNQYAGKIIACISGHTHFDAYGISSSGILYIETTSAAPHSHNYTTENIPNTPTVGTVTDTAFDFFVIDQEALTIEALRYGLGCNRKWVYKGENIGQVSGYPQEIVRQ